MGIFTTTAIISSCILIPDNIFPATLMFRLSRFTLATPFKFLLYSSVTLIPLLYLVKEYINRTFIINYFVLLLATLFFGAYYYMLMLFVPPILILIEHAHTIKYQKWIIAPITLNILINIVSPIYTAAENPIYCNQVNSIIAITSSIEQRLLEDPNTPKFYLESSISPSVITQGNNGRMLLFETDSMQIFDDIDAGDKIAITSARKMKLFLKHYRSSKNVTFENQELLAPVPGKLSIKSFYRKRTEPLGLWILTAKKA